MKKNTSPEFIESTAGQVAAELVRRGVAPDQRVTINIEPEEPDDWITKARKFARPKVLAERGVTRISTASSRKSAKRCTRPATDEAGR